MAISVVFYFPGKYPAAPISCFAKQHRQTMLHFWLWRGKKK